MNSGVGNLSLDSESAPPRYDVCQMSVKIDNFKFFGLNLEKNYSVACDILVLIALRVFQRAEWRLKWAGSGWIELDVGWDELDEGGWSWVEVGAGFINIHYFSFYYSYRGGRIFYLHILKYLMFLEQHRFIVVTLVKTFTVNFDSMEI